MSATDIGSTTGDWRPSSTIDALRIRAGMLRTVREFLAERGVMEVQTPALGAATVTDPAIESMRAGVSAPERYLQTSPEYHMKRLLAAGAPSIYQIGPVFRAGEQGRWHNPEFTMLEWYRLDVDAPRLMDEVAELVDALLGPAAYERLTYSDLVRRRFGVDPSAEMACLDIARRLGIGDDARIEEALDLLLAEAIASSGTRRLFVTDFPSRLAALARVEATGTAARFELILDGIEVANGYRELRDPDELEIRMAADNQRRRVAVGCEVEADRRLLAAQRHGLPDCAGVAVGFDRLVALRLGVSDVRKAMAFDWERA